MKMSYKCYDCNSLRETESTKEYTIEEFKNHLKSTFKKIYKIKFTESDKELITIYIYNGKLSHINTYDKEQFKK